MSLLIRNLLAGTFLERALQAVGIDISPSPSDEVDKTSTRYAQQQAHAVTNGQDHDLPSPSDETEA